MAKPKTQGPTVILEREHIVPLRKGWLKVPKYKRGAKAVKTLKEFLAQHMKVYDRDLRKIKLDIILNNEIRFRGMKKPPARIKVKAKKFDDGLVRVELAELPPKLKFAKLRSEKKKSKIEEKVKQIESVKKQAEKPEIKKEESEDTKEKEQSSKEETMKIAEKQAKAQKHTSKGKEVIAHRKALAK